MPHDFDLVEGAVDEVTACKRLVCHIIYQAVEDFRMLERNGVIVNGGIVRGEMGRIRAVKNFGKDNVHGTAVVGRYMQHEFSAQQLMTFLTRDMDTLIDLAHLNGVCGDAIRQELGITAGMRTRMPVVRRQMMRQSACNQYGR